VKLRAVRFSIATPSASTLKPLSRRNSPSTIVVLRSTPRIPMSGLVTVTASWYTPGETSTSAPGFAASTAAWIVG
jgi:hypothetical protein